MKIPKIYWTGLNLYETLGHDGTWCRVLPGSEFSSHLIEGYPVHAIVGINPFNEALLY